MKNFKLLRNIKMLVLDVDGVLTDTRIFMDNHGEWRRYFSVRDGVGIKELLERGYPVALITGSKATDIQERVKSLKIPYFFEGYLDKIPAFEQLKKDCGIDPRDMAYVGDDIYDLPLIRQVGFSATVPEAVEEVLHSVNYVTKRPGGMGAVREICDFIIKYGFYSKGGHQ
jgi:3-deoxy-D-manno-octulosonate 8-phosphate phosphatase (KDO 8-P phosphatase)